MALDSDRDGDLMTYLVVYAFLCLIASLAVMVVGAHRAKGWRP